MGCMATVWRETTKSLEEPRDHLSPLSNQFKLRHRWRRRRARCSIVQALVGEISNSLQSSFELMDSASWSQKTWAIRGGNFDRHLASTFWNSAFSTVS